MKTIRVLSLLLAAAMLLSLCACGGKGDAGEDQLYITATTYPLYALTAAITAGAEGVEVRHLNTGSVSCLHDYTLTVADMRDLERADVLILNGAGLEDFLHQAVSGLACAQVDCSASIDLLEGDGHDHHSQSEDHDHDHDHEHDPHYWMDPRNMAKVAQTISAALAQADPGQAQLYRANGQAVQSALECAWEDWYARLSTVSCPYLITFHDGFSYFAEAFGLELLFSMEEEDGATASAKDILTAATLVKEYSLPAVFTEANGSNAAARAVFGETGVAVSQLSMLMSGPDAPEGLSATEILEQLYLAPMDDNVRALLEVLK